MDKGKIFVDFKGTERIRLMEGFTTKKGVEMVRVANLRPPGGTFLMPLGRFKAQFSLEMPPVSVTETKQRTNEKYKTQPWNPYSGNAKKAGG